MSRQRPSADRVMAQQPVRGSAEGALRALQAHVDGTTKRIEQLLEELSRARAQHHQLCEERNDLLQRLATSTAARDEEAATETEWHRIKRERDALRASVARLERENEQLRLRTDWLQREWTEERIRRENSEQELQDLAVRIDQLDARAERLSGGE